MRKQISTHIQQCDTCQRYQQKPTDKAPLMPISASARAFQRLGIDIIGPLPVTCQGRYYILTIEDHLTKWPEVFAIETANTQTIIGILYNKFSATMVSPRKSLQTKAENLSTKP